jgi:hypothetical protein
MRRSRTRSLFSKAANLGVIPPAAMSFSIQGQVPRMATGALIGYRVRVGSAPRSLAHAQVITLHIDAAWAPPLAVRSAR